MRNQREFCLTLIVSALILSAGFREISGQMIEPDTAEVMRRANARRYALSKKKAEIEKITKPEKKYFDSHKEFLKAKNNGITKIYLAEITQRPIHISDGDNKLIPLEGAYYNFQKKLRSTTDYEIMFSDGRIKIADSEKMFGRISALGNIPLENVNASSPIVEKFYGLTAPKSLQENGESFSDLQSGMTYVLRTGWEGTVAEKSEKPFHTKIKSKKVSYLNPTIIFQIIGQDADSGYIVLWRQLKQ